MKPLVLIPLYNEQDSVSSVLQQVRENYYGDLLVVDDGSSDRSVSLLQAINDLRLTIILHSKNMGYGAALRTGFQYAIKHCYDVVISMDCDFQHCPQHIQEFLNGWSSCDVLSGSRYLQNSPFATRAPADRVRINAVITERINGITSFGITDAFCGYKAYRVDKLAKLRITEPGYGMPLQFWIQAYAAGLSVKEIPVARLYTHLDRSFGLELDDPERRLHYYENIIEEELQRCAMK